MALIPRRFKLIKQGLDDGTVLDDLADVASSSATNGQTIIWNGTSWVPADVSDISGNLDGRYYTESEVDALLAALSFLTEVTAADVNSEAATDGQILIADGAGAAAWGDPPASSPLTTKGDLYTYSTDNARLAVGTDGYVLTADSAEATGLKWAAATGGGGGTAIDGDPFWANVVLLVRMDGADAATAVTDDKGNAWTFFGDAQLDTAQQKFGTASLLLDGTGDYISTPDQDKFSVGSQDFTIEAWVKRNATGVTHTIINKRDGTSAEEFDLNVNDSDFPDGGILSGGSYVARVTSPDTLTDTDWHHIAMCRNGATLYLFVDGVLKDTDTAGTSAASSNTNVVYIGRNGFSSARDWNGWIDSVRMTVGVARYTETFTPPTVEFPVGGPEYVAGSIDSLSDVDTTTLAPAVGDRLAWDGTNWVPEPALSLGALIVAASPTAYWPCQETSGTTVEDVVSTNDLSHSGSSSFEARSLLPNSPEAWSLRVIGGDQAGIASSILTTPAAGDWSFECMAFLPRTTSTSNYRLATISTTGETEAANYQLYCQVASGTSAGGVMRAFWEYGAGSDEIVNITPDAAVPVDVPVHLAWVKDGTANTVTGYVNGRRVGVASYANEPTGGSTATFALGDSTTNTANYYISHAALYEGVALTAAQILQRAKAAGVWGT